MPKNNIMRWKKRLAKNEEEKEKEDKERDNKGIEVMMNFLTNMQGCKKIPPVTAGTTIMRLQQQLFLEYLTSQQSLNA